MIFCGQGYNHLMYRIFNIALDSQTPIPELSHMTGPTDASIFRFVLSESNPAADTDINWFHHWHDPNGSISITAGRDDKYYWLRFPQLADFKIQLSEQKITGFKHRNTPDTTIRHMLLDQVIPRILGQQYQLILHAGAVVLENRKTVGIIGASGWGKSTLMSSFYQQGAELITDDCLLIEFRDNNVLGIPNYSGIRLYDDSASAVFGDQYQVSPMAHYSVKQRVLLEIDKAVDLVRSIQLDALFLLDDPVNCRSIDEVSVTTVRGMNELMALVGQTFVLDVTDKILMAKQFRYCGALLDSGLPMFKLRYPRDHTKLPDVRSAVEDATIAL